MPQMKAIRFHAPGGPEKLKLALEPIPAIGKNEVLIKVRAVGLIWPELSWPIYQKENGEYITHIPGHDFSGIITEIGSGTDSSFDLKVGDEVIAFTSRRNHDGGMAEYAVSDIDQVIPKPKNLDFIESAAVPLSALTAWQALFVHGNLQKGQRVLINAAAGGTGIWAVQFARNIGAHVIGTGSSALSQKILTQFGIDEFVNYKTQDLKATIGEVDLVLECIGGKCFESAVDVVKKDGLIVSINEPACQSLTEKKGIRGIFFIVSMDKDQLSKVSALIESGKVKPIVDKKYALEDARKAFEDAANGHVHGKVVVEVSEWNFVI